MIPPSVPGSDFYSRKTGVCWCGCGSAVEEGLFAPGHEEVAVGALMEQSYGSVVSALLAHGRGPFSRAWSYTPHEAESDAAVLAINRARLAGPWSMRLGGTLTPETDLAWDTKDFQRWPVLRSIVGAGPRLTLMFTDLYEAGAAKRNAAALEAFERAAEADGITLPPRNTREGMQARKDAFPPHEEPPLNRALGDLEAGGDPVEYAAELERIVAEEPRDVDAWVHLGNHEMRLAELAGRRDVARRHRERALGFYETAVGVGQLSMPTPFGYLTPWYQLSNRPFLRGLHGLMLAYWALGRLSEAARVAHDLLWLNPNDNTGARYVAEALTRGTAYEDAEDPED